MADEWGQKTIQFNMRLTPDTKDKIDSLSKRLGCSMSDAVTRAVDSMEPERFVLDDAGLAWAGMESRSKDFSADEMFAHEEVGKWGDSIRKIGVNMAMYSDALEEYLSRASAKLLRQKSIMRKIYGSTNELDTLKSGAFVELTIEDICQALEALDEMREVFSGLEGSLSEHGHSAISKMNDVRRYWKEKVKNVDVHPLTDASVRDSVWGLTDGHCSYCGCELDRNLCEDGSNRSSVFCIEHVVPRSAGGPDHIKNYVPSCWSCNTSKRDKHVLSFIKPINTSRKAAA